MKRFDNQSASRYVTCHCKNCGGGVEFPSEGVGQEIQCPHCGETITLQKSFPYRILGFAVILSLLVGVVAVFLIAHIGQSHRVSKSRSPLNEKESQIAELTKNAENGDEAAQYQLGCLYYQGIGITTDYRKALNWFLKAAEQSDPKAQRMVGVFYGDGLGVAKDYAEAVRWTRLAAQQGDSTAIYNIGYSYATGEGVPKNSEEAFRWFHKSALQGLDIAQFETAECYRTGFGVEQDLVEAYKWYTLVAAQKSQDTKEASAALAQLSHSLSPEQIKDAQQRARDFVAAKPIPEPPTESRQIVALTDESRSYEVQVKRIIVGQRCADDGLFSQFDLDALHKQKKELVYFEVSVKNVDGPQDASIDQYRFRLEDTVGNSYSVEQTRDYLSSHMQVGETCQGGIAFAVRYGHIPQKLIFDTGFMNTFTHRKYFAVADSLDTLAIFKAPLSER